MERWTIDFPALDFLIALAIGALIGIEREKRQEGREASTVGGLRTFIFLAETGAIAAWLALQLDAVWIFIAAGLMVTAILVTRYWVRLQAEPQMFGMTTEVAAILVFLLGGTTLFGYRELAVALAVVTLGLLAYKQPLHGLVGKVGGEDLTATLKLLFATFIVLPVLPNRTVDLWGAINPYKMWWLVILIAALSFVGYIASRWLGRQRGATLTGLFGGLVSSTAVTLSFARQSRHDASAKGMADALAAGVLASWVMMFGRILVITAVLYQPLAQRLLVPVAVMAAVTALLAFLNYRRGLRSDSNPARDVPLQNPFGLGPAVKFAILFAVVILVVKLATEYLPEQSLYLIAALAGLADVDPVALSMAEHARDIGGLNVAVAATIVAVVANTLTKCGFIVALGTAELRLRILLATLALIAAALLALALA